jgi:hypothetical protein
MGGFSAQLQSPQSSAPAGKGAGMSAIEDRDGGLHRRPLRLSNCGPRRRPPS